MGYVTEMFGVSLLLTILVELGVFGLIRMKTDRRRTKIRTLVIVVILANTLTNPAVVWLSWLRRIYFYKMSVILFDVLAESAAVIVEFLVYRRFLEKCQGLLAASLLVNSLSFLTGIILNQMTGGG